MKNLSLLTLILFGFFQSVKAQNISECEVAFISHYFILNNTSDTIRVGVDNKNQSSFPTDGPEFFNISPGEELEVSDLEWSGTFKNPTIWFEMSLNGDHEQIDLNIADKWIFEKLDKTECIYRCTVSSD